MKPSAMKAIASLLALLIVAFGATTWWALESNGVVVVETEAPNGSIRSTRVWYVEPDGEIWLEAGSPDHPWYLDVQRVPVLTLTLDGRSTRYDARPDANPSAHRRIRSLIRDRYGFRDRWVNLLVDTSRSVAVRLIPAALDPP